MKEGWKLKRIDKISENLDSRRKPITKGKRESGRYPYYGASGIVDYVSGYIYDEDILLVSEDGANLIARSTPIAFSVSGKVWVNNHAHVLRFPNLVTQRFVEYYFASIDISEYVTGAAQPKFNQAKLNALTVPIPDSIEDQHRIVSYLDTFFAQIDALAKQAEESLENAKALFQATLKELMEKKEGWEEKKLGEFAHMKAGDFVKASDIHDEYKEGLYPCYGGNGLRGYVAEPNQDGEYCLIGRQGALCGNINLAKGVFRATEHAVVVKPYSDIPPKLTYYLLTALNINQYATGAAQPGISVKNIEKIVTINIPPKDKWCEIETKLSSLSLHISQLQSNYTQTLANCQALKQALLRETFE